MSTLQETLLGNPMTRILLYPKSTSWMHQNCMKAVMQYRELTFVVVVGDMYGLERDSTSTPFDTSLCSFDHHKNVSNQIHLKPQKSPSSLFSWLTATQLLNTFSALIIWNLWLIHNEQSIQNEFQEAYPSPEWHPFRGMRFQGFCRQ